MAQYLLLYRHQSSSIVSGHTHEGTQKPTENHVAGYSPKQLFLTLKREREVERAFTLSFFLYKNAHFKNKDTFQS